ncbi:MAG: (d)CMP kinase [Brevinema sp.]
MIVTIDGPAGAGKSSISKMVAKHLSFDVLDTGAMYRAFAYQLKNKDILINGSDFEELLAEFQVCFENGRVISNGQDVTEFIRTPEMDIFTSRVVSVHPLVRAKMCELQRLVTKDKNTIAEGRDMGSNVFPNADVKIYLDASVEIRAKRRFLELQSRGIEKSLSDLEHEIALRDREDMSREFSPLCIPKDAVVIDTSKMSAKEVTTKIITLINQ